MPLRTTLLSASVWVLITLPSTALAQDYSVIKIPVGQQTNGVSQPTKGMLKAEVSEQFGEPNKQSEPKGSPPISKWSYETFVVYFESLLSHSLLISQIAIEDDR